MEQITLDQVVKSDSPFSKKIKNLTENVLGVGIVAAGLLLAVNYLTNQNNYSATGFKNGFQIRSFSKIDGIVSSTYLATHDSDPGRVDINKYSILTYVSYEDLNGDNKVDTIFMRPEWVVGMQFPASIICPSEKVEGNSCSFERKQDFKKYRDLFEKYDRDLRHQKARFGSFMQAKGYNIKQPGKHT